MLCSGCSRIQYRQQADREVDCLVRERTLAEYLLPNRKLAPISISRMADPASPDCGPLPPDDPAAAEYMACPYKSKGSSLWQERGQLADIEDTTWKHALPTDDEGVVRLNRQNAVQLALTHSRDYQFELESVYLRGLAVTRERFEFDTQWTGGLGLGFVQTGGNTTGGNRTLSFSDQLGFQKRFATGGQLLADFTNALTWEYRGGVHSAASAVSFRFLQPLMRRAFREIQLEPLTQAERSLLYQIRDFARFRKTFYVDTTGTSGYLGLLAVAQSVRNAEANMESLQRNLDEHDALLEAGLVSQFQVDQVYQDYEQGRLSLLQAKASFNTALDAFKLGLGLPPDLKTNLDSDELRQFELSDPALEALSSRNEKLRIELLQFAREQLPNLATLSEFHQRSQQIAAELPTHVLQIETELNRWLERLNASNEAERTPETELAERLASALQEIRNQIPQDLQRLEQIGSDIESKKPRDAWTGMNEICGDRFRERLADLFVIQTQVRVYLIETKPLQISEATAAFLANQNRLDLRNVQGQVVDAYRRTEVAADLLEADLDVVLGTDLGTDPGRINPLRFDSSASRFSAGLQFDGPLNRLVERNTYRASQIEYQRTRRTYMQAKDRILFDVRNTLRNLNLNRLQFEITRQQLITAARQVEQAQFNLRSSTEPDSNLTRDLLQALQSLLAARNSLISSWVNYENSRMEVYATLGLLQVDDFGTWLNDGQPFDDLFDSDPLIPELAFDQPGFVEE